MVQLARSVLGRLTQDWAERSQQQACRNAMVATTALTAARRERDEVEELVAQLLTRRSPDAPHRVGTASPRLPASRLG